MQFTTLFSFAASLALASAGVVQKRQFDGDVAILKVFDDKTADCTTDEPTVTIGVGPLALDQCIPFSQEYWTVSYSYLESTGYDSNFYTTDDCTSTPNEGNAESCYTSLSDNPWLSYKVVSPGNLRN
ncbi:hypothetical protein N8I77_008656 [Diaporthe amygdali]|uniref:Uncharacterized protein n=1 Tax=Phomopsis amygdali TaxID=1214568 RepID=A0AAD9S9R2_PHOAM|nr:hypothetical protein N8I77_008656 [Diaporthe amygdali]KAK2602095.1 hypothetical protein N8I77_008656 [Diaporthe amygdali]